MPDVILVRRGLVCRRSSSGRVARARGQEEEEGLARAPGAAPTIGHEACAIPHEPLQVWQSSRACASASLLLH
eukprot:6201410-Pleurochrysis_carterae.AAC.1